MTERASPQWRLVASKELRDLLGRLGRKPLTRTLGVVAIFGVLVPLRFPGAGNLPAFFAVFMAFVPARLVAIEAFAGERERGTLEVLLASPLSDRSIALGKLAAATVYGTLRSWLFVTVWVLSAALLAVTGLADALLPGLGVVVVTLAAAVVVAYGAAVFGLWQSARAPSVRAIVESGGVLRLALIVAVFFVLPWLLGLLGAGPAPRLAFPGATRNVSLGAAVDAVAAQPTVALLILTTAALLVAAALAALTVAVLRVTRRETLVLAANVAPRARFARRWRGINTSNGL